MVASYFTNKIPSIDANAVVLFIESVINYELKEDYCIDDDWICQCVVSEFFKRLL